jgi:hypothetical protein
MNIIMTIIMNIIMNILMYIIWYIYMNICMINIYITIDSSPLRCALTSICLLSVWYYNSLSKYAFNTYTTLGTLTAPPKTSTPSISLISNPLFNRHSYNGLINSPKYYSHLLSNYSLLIYTLKSYPSNIFSTKKVAYLLALRVSLNLLASFNTFSIA